MIHLATRNDRTARTQHNSKLKTVMVNTINCNYLASPTISAFGEEFAIDQCIALNRPLSDNFSQAIAVYTPNSISYSDRSTIEIKPIDHAYKREFDVVGHNKMIYGNYGGIMYSEGYGGLVSIGPAGQGSRVSKINFPASPSSFATGSNGSSGPQSTSSLYWYLHTDRVYASVGNTYSNDAAGRSSYPNIDMYASIDYLIDFKINNGIVSGDELVRVETTPGYYSMGAILPSGSDPNLNDLIDDIAANPKMCKMNLISSGSALDQKFHSDGAAKALVRTDLYKAQANCSYVNVYCPTVGISVINFAYNSSYPNMTMTIGLQYNMVIYGVANDPSEKYYGMIADNDGYGRRMSKNTVWVSGSSNPYTTIISSTDFVIESCVRSMNVASVTICSRNGNITASEIVVTSDAVYGSGGQNASSFIGKKTYTNVTIGTDTHYQLTYYAAYELSNGTRCCSDVQIKYGAKLLRFTIIKEPNMNVSGKLGLTVRVYSQT